MALDQWGVIKGITTVLNAESTFTDLVGANNVFGGEHIAASPSIPYLLIRIINFELTDGDDFYGDFRVDLQIDINGYAGSNLSDVLERMDELLIIPHKRTSMIEFSGGRIRHMRRTGAPMLGPFAREKDEQKIQQIASTWRLKVTQVT